MSTFDDENGLGVLVVALRDGWTGWFLSIRQRIGRIKVVDCVRFDAIGDEGEKQPEEDGQSGAHKGVPHVADAEERRYSAKTILKII